MPSVASATGSGTDRLYSFTDLIALCVARDLRAQGITTKALKRLVKQLRASGGSKQPLAEGGFIVAGKEVLKIEEGREELISLLAHPKQTAFAFVFDVARTEAEVKAALDKDAPGRKRPPRTKANVQKKQAS